MWPVLVVLWHLVLHVFSAQTPCLLFTIIWHFGMRTFPEHLVVNMDAQRSCLLPVTRVSTPSEVTEAAQSAISCCSAAVSWRGDSADPDKGPPASRLLSRPDGAAVDCCSAADCRVTPACSSARHACGLHVLGAGHGHCTSYFRSHFSDIDANKSSSFMRRPLRLS